MTTDYRNKTVRAGLLRRFMAEAPFQPATNFWRAIELTVLAAALPAEGRCLDVGCGDGVLTQILVDLIEARWSLVGIDPDPAETELALRTGLYAAVHTCAADAIPEPDGSFDLAIANSVLEHIPNLPQCLQDIGRCLKPGAQLLATVPSDRFRSLLRGPSLFQRGPRERYLEDTDRRLAHLQYWSADDWKFHLAEAGFELAELREYLSPRQVRRWEFWSNWTGGLLYQLRGNREPPIVIQRQLGLRRGLPAPLRLAARPLAWAVGCGALGGKAESTNGDAAGCYLVVARRIAQKANP